MDNVDPPPPQNSYTPATPPPIVLPPTPRYPAPRRGRGWMVIAVVLAVLLLFSLAVNFTSLSRLLPASVKPTMVAGPRLEEVLLRSGDGASFKLAVIDVEGIISGTRMDGSGVPLPDLIKAQFRKAERDARVKAVVLKVNSPGGEVLASDEINRIIAKFQADTGKPVIASMGNLAASGGYYVSAPCRWIVANELTITGSIGVIMSTWNYRALMDKVGLRPVVYKSGQFKNMLAGDRTPEEIPAEERKMLDDLIGETFTKFKAVVAEGRAYAAKENQSAGRRLAENWSSFADGRILTGRQAHELGFVDELGDFDAAVKRAKAILGLREVDLVQYRQLFDLADLFSLFGKSEARSLKIDLGFEAPKLQSGQPYFLAPTFLH